MIPERREGSRPAIFTREVRVDNVDFDTKAVEFYMREKKPKTASVRNDLFTLLNLLVRDWITGAFRIGWERDQSTMAVAAAMCTLANVTLSSSGARLPRKLATVRKSSFFSPSPELGGCLVRRRGNVHARRRSLVVRAARTESKGVSLGFRAPDFELEEPLTGKTWKLEDFEAYPALLVMFICNHCPFVKHLKKDIVKLTNFYMKKGLGVVAISSNSVATHPQDGPEFMAEDARLFKYPFPYLYDHTQEVAKDFGAVCTPEFFLFKKDGRRPFELVYHGQFDDSRPSNNVRVTGRDLGLAIDRVLSGQPIPADQKPSVGCSIKWHPETKV